MSEDASVERLSVGEAAERLGVTRDAIHKRITRGSIKHETGEDGRIYVYVDTSTTVADASTDKSNVEVMERLIANLERELEEANERDRENRRIIAMLTSRIPTIEAPGVPGEAEVAEDAPESPQAHYNTQTPPDAGGDAQEGTGTPGQEPRRGFWSRLFGS